MDVKKEKHMLTLLSQVMITYNGLPQISVENHTQDLVVNQNLTFVDLGGTWDKMLQLVKKHVTN